MFPEGVVALQQFARVGELALFEYGESLDEPRWQPEAPVSLELEVLLESARQYPPALALAREDVDAAFKEKPAIASLPSEFAEIYSNALRYHLQQQCTAGYVLARAVVEEPGYLWPGHWYWVVGAKGDPALVQWVSTDLEVYTNMATDFDLTTQQLTALETRVHRWLWWSNTLPSTPFKIVEITSAVRKT